MATKNKNIKKAQERKEQVKGNMKKFNDGLIKTSEDVITGTVKAGEKWQSLVARTIKKTEPIAEKNIDMVFDAAERIKGEISVGSQRMRSLLGIKENVVADIKEKITSNETYKKYKGEIEEIVEGVADSEVAKRAKKIVTKAKVEVSDTIEEIKEEVKEAVETVEDKIDELSGKSAEKTDLKVIKGIGPKLESVLNEAGIYNYSDLAKASVEDLQEVLVKAGPRYRMHNPEEWKTQVTDLMAATK